MPRTPSANAKFGYAGPSLPEPAAPRPSAFQQLSREGEFGGDRTTGSFDQHNLMTGKEEGYGALPRYRVEAEAAKPGIDLTGELNNAPLHRHERLHKLVRQSDLAARFMKGSTLPSGPRNPSSEVDLTEKLGRLAMLSERNFKHEPRSASAKHSLNGRVGVSLLQRNRGIDATGRRSLRF
jgi:hypothetical protein